MKWRVADAFGAAQSPVQPTILLILGLFALLAVMAMVVIRPAGPPPHRMPTKKPAVRKGPAAPGKPVEQEEPPRRAESA
jgi:hypothetical protein